MSNLSQPLVSKAKKYVRLSDSDKVEILTTLYRTNGMSWNEVAETCCTYSNKVRRDAKRLGIKSRDKSEAQKLALKTGRHSHPTKDKGHSEATKVKISDKVSDIWESMPKEERAKRKAFAKAKWDSKTPEEIKAFREAAGEGVRKAAKEGSALEQFLLLSLIENNYKVDFHKERWVVRENLQIDIYLPELNVAIEVDGPSHFRNIWGGDSLVKNKIRDAAKDGLLLSRGICILRIRQEKALSHKYQRNILAKLLDTLKSIEEKFPTEGNRHIILGDS